MLAPLACLRAFADQLPRASRRPPSGPPLLRVRTRQRTWLPLEAAPQRVSGKVPALEEWYDLGLSADSLLSESEQLAVPCFRRLMAVQASATGLDPAVRTSLLSLSTSAQPSRAFSYSSERHMLVSMDVELEFALLHDHAPKEGPAGAPAATAWTSVTIIGPEAQKLQRVCEVLDPHFGVGGATRPHAFGSFGVWLDAASGRLPAPGGPPSPPLAASPPPARPISPLSSALADAFLDESSHHRQPTPRPPLSACAGLGADALPSTPAPSAAAFVGSADREQLRSRRRSAEEVSADRLIPLEGTASRSPLSQASGGSCSSRASGGDSPTAAAPCPTPPISKPIPIVRGSWSSHDIDLVSRDIHADSPRPKSWYADAYIFDATPPPFEPSSPGAPPLRPVNLHAHARVSGLASDPALTDPPARLAAEKREPAVAGDLGVEVSLVAADGLVAQGLGVELSQPRLGPSPPPRADRSEASSEGSIDGHLGGVGRGQGPLAGRGFSRSLPTPDSQGRHKLHVGPPPAPRCRPSPPLTMPPKMKLPPPGASPTSTSFSSSPLSSSGVSMMATTPPEPRYVQVGFHVLGRDAHDIVAEAQQRRMAAPLWTTEWRDRVHAPSISPPFHSRAVSR